MKNRLLLLFLSTMMVGSLPARSPSMRTGLLTAAALGTGGLYGGLKLARRRALRASLAATQERTLAENSQYWLRVDHKMNSLQRFLDVSGFGASGLAVAALVSLLLDARGTAPSHDNPAEPHPSPSPIIPLPHSSPVLPPPSPPPAPPVDPIDVFRVKKDGLSAEQKVLAATVNGYADRVKALGDLAKKTNKATGEKRTQLAAQAAQDRADLMAQQAATYDEILKLPQDEQHVLIEALNGDHRFGAFETKVPPKKGWQDGPVFSASEKKLVTSGPISREKEGELVRMRFNAALKLDPINGDLSAVAFFAPDEIALLSEHQQERAMVANFELAKKHMEHALHEATEAKLSGNENYEKFITEAYEAYHNYLNPANPSRQLAGRMRSFEFLFGRKRQQLSYTNDEWKAIEEEEKRSSREQEKKRQEEYSAREVPSVAQQEAIARLIAQHDAEHYAKQEAAHEEQQRILWEGIAKLEKKHDDDEAKRVAEVNDFIGKHEAVQKRRGVQAGVGAGAVINNDFFPTDKAIAAEIARHAAEG